MPRVPAADAGQPAGVAAGGGANYGKQQLTDNSSITFQAAIDRIASRAQHHDISGVWPDDDLADLARCGAMRWAIPSALGGDALSGLELHLRYEKLAAASLSTALVLTQRDSAIGYIADTEHAGRWLADCLDNQAFTTVGIAQLTTSRQGAQPAMRATVDGSGFIINGVVPWCTGAAEADFIVTGAVLPDGQQLLLAIDPRQSGVAVGDPMRLVALSSTHTAELSFCNVRVEHDRLLRGPAAAVLSSRRGGLPLGQAFLAMGLCRSALNLIATHTSDRAKVVHDRFADQLTEVRNEVIAPCAPGREADGSAANARLRAGCNSLASRLTQAAVALFKGSALLANHPAQRLAREAMFLLVWSCPNPVIECTVDLFSDAP